MKKRKENPVKSKGAKRLKISCSEKKFSTSHLKALEKNYVLDNCINLPSSMKSKFWLKTSKNLIAKSVSKATWKTRNAALQKLLAFLKTQKLTLSWPLEDEKINGFILWCFANKMSPLTINSYVFSLSSLQKNLGFGAFKIKNSQAEILLKGAKNSRKLLARNRKPITLKILESIKEKLKIKIKNKLLKKVIWSAFTMAFFGCLRMGEIVCENENTYHKDSAFCWEDIKIHESYLQLNLKNTKNNQKNVKIYIFKYAKKKLCPFRAFLSYKKTFQKIFNVSSSVPVFRMDRTTLLTKRFLNKFLKEHYTDLSCHSFRAGIPSAIEKIPNSLFKKQIMNFGRWNSNSFSSYQRYKLSQKKWIFVNIEKALLNKN
jgi:hypothetical protein